MGLGKSFDAAQRAYDDRMPDDDDSDPCGEKCPRCDGGGMQYAGEDHTACEECGGGGMVYHHRWHMLRGEALDGTKARRCTKCGLEEVI